MELVTEESLRKAFAPLFSRLKLDILTLIPASRIEEIGSSAIPGAITKGDLDILVVVEERLFDDSRERLSKAYDINEMEEIELFCSFKCVREGVDVGIQLSTFNATIFDFLAFREALRNSKNLVNRYNQVKLDARTLTEDEYRAKKHRFIEMVLSNL